MDSCDSVLQVDVENLLAHIHRNQVSRQEIVPAWCEPVPQAFHQSSAGTIVACHQGIHSGFESVCHRTIERRVEFVSSRRIDQKGQTLWRGLLDDSMLKMGEIFPEFFQIHSIQIHFRIVHRGVIERLLHVVEEDADLARVVDAAREVVGSLARVGEVPGVRAGD